MPYVLKVLASANPNLKSKADTIDISKTNTTEFVDHAK